MKFDQICQHDTHKSLGKSWISKDRQITPVVFHAYISKGLYERVSVDENMCNFEGLHYQITHLPMFLCDYGLQMLYFVPHLKQQVRLCLFLPLSMEIKIYRITYWNVFHDTSNARTASIEIGQRCRAHNLDAIRFILHWNSMSKILKNGMAT